MVLEAQDDLTVVGEAGDGAEAVRLAAELRPGRRADGRPHARAWTASRPPGGSSRPAAAPRVLILTTFDLDEYAFAGLRAGASGFLLKDVPPDDLLAGIRAVAGGDAVVAPSVTRRLLDSFAHRLPRRRRRPADADPRSTALTDARARGAGSRSPRALQRARSPSGSCCPRRPSRPTSAASWPSSACATASRPSIFAYEIGHRSLRLAALTPGSNPNRAIRGAVASPAVLLTVTTTHRPGHRPRLPAAQAPGARAVVRAAVRHGARLLSRRRPTSAARRRCCSTSTRSAWSRRGRGGAASRSTSTSTTGPYVASSFLSVALRQRLQDRDGRHVQGAARSWPRRRSRSRRGCRCVPARGGERARAAAVRAARLRGRASTPIRSTSVPGVGRQPLRRPRARRRRAGCADLLNHLYVLLPVLDDDKHYWVGEAEIEKLLRRGEGWLAAHPERELIVRRYLKHAGAALLRAALAQLGRGRADAAEPTSAAPRGGSSRSACRCATSGSARSRRC